MSRIHFFEAMERSNNYQREYRKLEELCAERQGGLLYDSNRYSINNWIADNFRSWKKRSNYTSYNELRAQLGFPEIDIHGYVGDYTVTVDLNKYLLYCEMIINLIYGLNKCKVDCLDSIIQFLFDTIRETIEKVGLEISSSEEQFIIVEKNAVAIEVADKVPEVASVVVEYNQYLLKGCIDRKKELLGHLAEALEPKRKILNGLNGQWTNDFFELVNTMNVRHNNCDSSDSKKYNSMFVDMSPTEKEDWYDLIFEQGLALFMLLEQEDRNRKIEAYKKHKNNIVSG